MSQITSDASIHAGDIRDTQIRGDLGGLGKRIAIFLGIRPYPGESLRAIRRSARKEQKNDAADWKVAEWSITQSDPKSFSW